MCYSNNTLNKGKNKMNEEKHICAYCGKDAKFELKNGKWCCEDSYHDCPGYKNHLSEALKKAHVEHLENYLKSYKVKHFRFNDNPWNKGLTKETSDSIKKMGENLHARYQSGEVIQHWSPEQRAKVSISMKKAHAEGRAHNIGECRWHNQPSYPESFFMKVIQNEFQNKEYIREFPFHKYSLDFAWIKEKKCIEIDGEQHERFFKQDERDQKKDEFLKLDGWKELRIKWKDMCKDSKKWIQLAKNFIDN